MATATMNGRANAGAKPSLVHDEPASPTRRGSWRAADATTPLAARRTSLARLLVALGGDEYMLDAYPPAVAPTKEH